MMDWNMAFCSSSQTVGRDNSLSHLEGPDWRLYEVSYGTVFGVPIRFDFKTVYLADLEELHCTKQDLYLLRKPLS